MLLRLSSNRAFLRLSPRAGRGTGRLRRPSFSETPKRSFGYAATADRVRGSLRELLRQSFAWIEAPHPNPLPVRTGRGSEGLVAAPRADFGLKFSNDFNVVHQCMGLFSAFLIGRPA
jgi:hypothetical protein